MEILYYRSMNFSVSKANPKVIEWARKGVELDLNQASKLCRIKEEDLEAIEKGELVPKKSQLKKIATVYKRPWAIFLLPNVPQYTLQKPKWRTLPTFESLSLKSKFAIKRAEEIQNFYSELNPSRKVSSVINKKFEAKDPEVLADTIRQALLTTVEDQSNWDDLEVFDKWRKKIEKEGVLVLQGALNIKELRAFSIVENDPKLIFVSSKDTINGKVFSLFHELAHILIKDSSLCKASDFNEYQSKQVEVFCNHFAGAFLVPSKVLLDHTWVQNKFRKEWDETTLSKLSRYFKVSKEVILRRLVILKMATQEFYEAKKEEWSKLPPKKPFGRSKDTEAKMVKSSINSNGYNATSAVLNNLNQGNITLVRASDYLSLKPKYFSRLEQIFNWNV